MNRIISINEWLVMVIVCVLTSVLDLTDYDGLRTFFFFGAVFSIPGSCFS